MANLTRFIGGQHYTETNGDTEHLNVAIVSALPATLAANTLYLITEE